MIVIKRVFYSILIVLSLLIFSSCNVEEIPVNTEEEPTKTTSLEVALNNMKNGTQYKVEKTDWMLTKYDKGFNRRYFYVLFNDPTLLAYSLDEADRIVNRIVNFNQELSLMYRHEDTFIKGDPIGANQSIHYTYNHVIFEAIENAIFSKKGEGTDIYVLNYKYSDMLEKYPGVIQLIDQMMYPSISSDVDVSNTIIKLTISVGQSFVGSRIHSISIDAIDYVSQKYPLISKTNDTYQNVAMLFIFEYEDFQKDFTAETTYTNDDHSNFVTEEIEEITIGQSVTANLQYFRDYDFFKITLSEPKTLTFAYTGIDSSFYLYKQNENKSTYIPPGEISLEAGTYYISIHAVQEGIGTISFSFTE
jgi:hypothetical protein